ncbi:putative transcription factor c2h2 protein [Botrytis fragariae]|uniref:Putative transcription factor c2h2 protein n=1 Tax=Botrytis fragariae TaxID=1964551 RepID=A0A8H6AQ45_9HELO|nr:putative transcription factor c2h2 protein [Botrytis fragariae]KAF5871429.1 putative transcription factor c2h2 protein [Botrytis fragariae]
MAQNRSQFHCGYLGCNKTFTRRTGARRHETTVHGDKKYCCSEPDCNYRGGKRRHDFKKHMQNKHPGYDDHLFVPEDFSNLQGSHSLVADRSRSPEVVNSSQISGNFSPIPPPPSTRSSSRYIPVNAHEVPSTSSMVPLASAGVPQSHDNTISPTIISLRPPDTCEFQDVHPPRSEFEQLPTTTTAIGSIWSQVDPSAMCDLDSGLHDMTRTCVENDYATFESGYDLSRYGQPGNDPYHRW